MLERTTEVADQGPEVVQGRVIWNATRSTHFPALPDDPPWLSTMNIPSPSSFAGTAKRFAWNIPWAKRFHISSLSSTPLIIITDILFPRSSFLSILRQGALMHAHVPQDSRVAVHDSPRGDVRHSDYEVGGFHVLGGNAYTFYFAVRGYRQDS